MIHSIFSRPSLRSNPDHAGLIGHWAGAQENSAVASFDDLGSAIDHAAKLAWDEEETCVLLYSLQGEPNAEMWRCPFPGGLHDARRALADVNGWTWEPDTQTAVIFGKRPRRLDAMPGHTITKVWAVLCMGRTGEMAVMS